MVSEPLARISVIFFFEGSEPSPEEFLLQPVRMRTALQAAVVSKWVVFMGIRMGSREWGFAISDSPWLLRRAMRPSGRESGSGGNSRLLRRRRGCPPGRHPQAPAAAIPGLLSLPSRAERP